MHGAKATYPVKAPFNGENQCCNWIQMYVKAVVMAKDSSLVYNQVIQKTL